MGDCEGEERREKECEIVREKEEGRRGGRL